MTGALFAKTCLMSRREYQGMWVDFYPDECAEPLALLPIQELVPVPQPRIADPVRKTGTLYNPYEVLADSDFMARRMGDEEGSSEDA